MREPRQRWNEAFDEGESAERALYSFKENVLSALSSSESRVRQLWEVVVAVDEADTTYLDAYGDFKCIYCNGNDNLEEQGFVHTDDCLAIKVRKIKQSIKEP